MPSDGEHVNESDSSKTLSTGGRTFGMPQNMAVECPDARIISADPEHDVGVAWNGDGIPSHWGF